MRTAYMICVCVCVCVCVGGVGECVRWGTAASQPEYDFGRTLTGCGDRWGPRCRIQREALSPEHEREVEHAEEYDAQLDEGERWRRERPHWQRVGLCFSDGFSGETGSGRMVTERCKQPSSGSEGLALTFAVHKDEGQLSLVAQTGPSLADGAWP